MTYSPINARQLVTIYSVFIKTVFVQQIHDVLMIVQKKSSMTMNANGSAIIHYAITIMRLAWKNVALDVLLECLQMIVVNMNVIIFSAKTHSVSVIINAHGRIGITSIVTVNAIL